MDQPTSPTPPQPQAPQNEPANEPLDVGPTPVAPKSSGALTWLIIILLIVLLGGGTYYYLFIYSGSQTSSSSSTESVTPATTPSSTTGTSTTSTAAAITKAYTSTTAIKPTAAKSIALDSDLYAILKTTFTDEVNLKEDFNGTMLTYVVNRAITAADVTSVLTDLETAGYTKMTADTSGFTVSKSSATYVFTFSVASTSKAIVEVTF